MSETRARMLWAAASPLFRSVGRAFFSLRVEGAETLPEPPYVVAANHYSHFDGPLLGAVLRQPVRFLVLEDLFGERPVFDWLVLGSGAIPTPRGRLPLRALRTALAALEAGEVVGVFPEATRVSHWGTLPPKRGAAWLAIRIGVPLLPAAVIGTGRALGLDNRLHRAPIEVVIGQAMHGDEPNELTRRWADWVTDRIAEHPASEVSGPRRAFHS